MRVKRDHAVIANIKGPYDYKETSKVLEEVTKNTRDSAAALRRSAAIKAAC